MSLMLPNSNFKSGDLSIEKGNGLNNGFGGNSSVQTFLSREFAVVTN